MKDLKVDNEELNALADRLENLSKDVIGKFINELRDKDEDIFTRYIAYIGGGTLIKMSKFVLDLNHSALKSGFKLQNKIFQTKRAIKNGWDDPKTENHPFFIQEEDEEIMKKAEDFLKDLFARASKDD